MMKLKSERGLEMFLNLVWRLMDRVVSKDKELTLGFLSSNNRLMQWDKGWSCKDNSSNRKWFKKEKRRRKDKKLQLLRLRQRQELIKNKKPNKKEQELSKMQFVNNNKKQSAHSNRRQFKNSSRLKH